MYTRGSETVPRRGYRFIAPVEQPVYIAFGMTEALIIELSHVGALKVISQTSIMQYKGLRKPLKQIAGELGAGTIVEGSVLREGDEVRITVQLIDAPTDTHLWAQSYGRDSASALLNQPNEFSELSTRLKAVRAPPRQGEMGAARIWRS